MARKLSRWREAAQGIAALIGMLLMLAALPFILPIVAFKEYRSKKLLNRVAAQAHCQTCGEILGVKSVDKANVLVINIAGRQGTDWKSRQLRDLWAACDACGTDYNFDWFAKRFTKLPPDRQAFYRSYSVKTSVLK